MRIGEVLKLTPSDVVERKLLVRDPKSGREAEIIFIPQKVADRLKAYVKNQNPVIWKAQVVQGVTVSVTPPWYNGLNK